jgi:hypothetical protein
MIALTATSVVENFIAAVSIADGPEALHDLSGCGIPVNFFEGAISPSAKRRGNAIFAVLIVVEARCLLTQIPLRGWMIFIASDPHDLATFDASGLHFDAAIEFAQDACA